MTLEELLILKLPKNVSVLLEAKANVDGPHWFIAQVWRRGQTEASTEYFGSTPMGALRKALESLNLMPHDWDEEGE